MNKEEEKRKNYSKVSKNSKKNKEISIKFDDVELLRIQGLIRCNVCKTPCPIHEILCPTCGAKA